MRQAFIQRRRDLASHHGTQVARKAGAHLSLQLLADHLLQVGAHGLVVHHLRNGLGNDLRDRQMRQRGGIVRVPDGPGLGIEIDQAVLDQYKVA